MLGLVMLGLLAADPEVPADNVVGYDAIEDVVYGHKDGLALTMDVLTPKEGAKGIGVLLISSGGWHSGKSDVLANEDRRRTGEHWVQGLLRGGYTLFIVRHGSLPRYRVVEMIDDVRRSIRFVRHHADRFHVDPDKLIITSGSSGGHLSLMAGLTGDDGHAGDKDPVNEASSRVQAIVSWFAPTDLVNWGGKDGYKIVQLARPDLFKEVLGEIKDLKELPVQLKGISPIEQISADDPPVLLIHGDKDRTVPLQQSKVFAAAYETAGRPVKLIVHAGGDHTVWPGIIDQYPEVWAWVDEAVGKKD